MKTEPIALIVLGAAGRMGRRIVALATEDARFRVVGAVESPGSPAIGADAGETAGIGRLGVTIGSDLASLASPAATIIDFTAPEASIVHLRIASAAKAPIVVGTTGFTSAQRAEARRSRAPCRTHRSNMSLGVNVLLGLVERRRRAPRRRLRLEIFEVHHGRKKDSPSGTALALAESAARAAGLDPATAFVSRVRAWSESVPHVRSASSASEGATTSATTRSCCSDRRAHGARAPGLLERLPGDRCAQRRRLVTRAPSGPLFHAGRGPRAHSLSPEPS